MLVYHFLNEQFGLEDIARRRLKVALIEDLNDPFELRAWIGSNARLRAAFERTRKQIATNRGMLCFSLDWHNPVQWSHYADKHRGVALGFEVTDSILERVNYLPRRIVPDLQSLVAADDAGLELMRQNFTTKFSHWRYEKEVRAFVELDEKDPEKGLYFVDFSEDLKLRKVVVGANSSLTRPKIESALGDMTSTVEVQKARLAFNTFRVVMQRNKEAWC